MGSVTKRFDVCAARKYQTRNGEDKTHWINCGEAAQWDDGGISLRMHSVPVGSWFDGSLKLFERKERDSEQQPRNTRHTDAARAYASRRDRPQQAPPPSEEDFPDDIPF